MRENDIYPKFDFRLSHEEKAQLTRRIEQLKQKFNANKTSNEPVITKSVLIAAALKRGLLQLESYSRLSEPE